MNVNRDVSRRVLIVDDFEDISSSLAELVCVLGHEARAANHGAQALALAQEFRPDLVLLDLGMPDPDGFEIARQLRKQAGDTIEIVAMSGWGDPTARQRAREAGFDRHYVKPLTIAHLHALLAAPLKAR